MKRRNFLQSTPMVVAAGLASLHRQGNAQPVGVDASANNAIDRLHQVIIFDGTECQSRLPETIQTSSELFRRMYPMGAYTLWTEPMLREFMAHHFDRTVMDAFDQLLPNAYKADLARYCLLYELGGLYSDLGLHHEVTWKIPKHYKTAGFLENNPGLTCKYDISTGMMWSRPKSPILYTAIQGIVENCRNRFYGNRPIDPTGPGLVGSAWAEAYVADWRTHFHDEHYLGTTHVTVGDDYCEMQFLPIGNEAGKQPVARRLPRSGGDSRYLGMNAKSYRQMWQDREVYR